MLFWLRVSHFPLWRMKWRSRVRVALRPRCASAPLPFFTERTGHTVRIVRGSDERLGGAGAVQQILATGSSDVDVFRIDGTWQGMMRPHVRPRAAGGRAERGMVPADHR